MSYIGEDEYFSYRDGKCELLNKHISPSAAAVLLGRKLGAGYRRFCAGCCSYGNVHGLYSVCSGIAESGKDVYVCENTDLPSLLFSRPVLSADCAVYLHESGGDITFSLFDKYSFPFSDNAMRMLLDTKPSEVSGRCGKMLPVTSFNSIFANNIADSFNTQGGLPAGVSCGNSLVRGLWLRFFSGESSDLAFQVSDDGQRVNAYSLKYGFLSHEKLCMCFALKLLNEGKSVYLPENFHHAADQLSSTGIIRFQPGNVPEQAARQRFLTDPLFMCAGLASDLKAFGCLIESLPAFGSSRREITVSDTGRMPVGRSFTDRSGTIRVTRSGRNRIALAVQSYSAEAAAELCCLWTEKFRRLDVCGTIE